MLRNAVDFMDGVSVCVYVEVMLVLTRVFCCFGGWGGLSGGASLTSPFST